MPRWRGGPAALKDLTRDRVTVETRLAPRLGRAHVARIDAAVARLGAFRGLPAAHVAG
ncbi:MAG TPA: hypothetical protein VFY98_09010 [Intrasporangium sp.]|nr:hypothetical protein [Intrasporangium sp.]